MPITLPQMLFGMFCKTITKGPSDKHISLTENGNDLSEPKEVAECFNDYFIDSINDLVGEINDECETSTPFWTSQSDNCNFIYLYVEYCPSMISQKFVLKTISSLSCKKSHRA